MKLGGMVRDTRRGLGLTQEEAASRANIARRTLVTIEGGGGTVANLTRLAEVIELRLTDLPLGRTLGHRLTLARTRREWTQADLAERAGISIPTVRALENDRGTVASLSAVLAVLAPKARPKRRELATWQKGRVRDVRYTPQHLLDAITGAFGRISLDPCAGEGSFVQADRYITEDEDGLVSAWSGRLAYVNPPFSAATAWIERSYQAWASGEVETVIALLPARTATRVFHSGIAGVADVLLLNGRLRFYNPSDPRSCGLIPMDLMICTWGGDPQAVRTLTTTLGARLMERDQQAA